MRCVLLCRSECRCVLGCHVVCQWMPCVVVRGGVLVWFGVCCCGLLRGVACRCALTCDVECCVEVVHVAV